MMTPREKKIIEHAADPVTTGRFEVTLGKTPVFICCEERSRMFACFGKETREWWANFENLETAMRNIKDLIPNDYFGIRIGSLGQPDYTPEGKRKIYEEIFG